MKKLFGTDGIRGIVNKELTPELAMSTGKAIAKIFNNLENKSKILIGKDTRVSCDMLEGALVSGLCFLGADVVLLGIVPTPAVAFLTRKYGADAGIMISASHNPYNFNGIKIFNNEGYKISDEIESKIEKIILQEKEIIPTKQNLIGRVFFEPNSTRDYVDHIKRSTKLTFDGLRVAFDCSNGAAFRSAKLLFEELGCDCKMLFCEPDGMNINDHCGSVHFSSLSNFVKNNDVDLGIAFDGDADRCLAVDENGNIVDGDSIMAICGYDMKLKNNLLKNTIVGTDMANLGLRQFCAKNDINFVSTKVGDRHVLSEMIKNGFNLGGEQSGHIIFKDFSTTGDGQLTATVLLDVVKRTGEKLSKLTQKIEKIPQVIASVEVSNRQKHRFEGDVEIISLIKEAEEKLGNDGRLLVRASGTEPLIRIMVEWKNHSEIDEFLKEFTNKIRAKIL
ncbi:MAG: phosphoglucosamine mutase [Oscillospiraceae bacterium]|nr:phosphoglucosamine mutase [Oscillospiraceae bacterium]